MPALWPPSAAAVAALVAALSGSLLCPASALGQRAAALPDPARPAYWWVGGALVLGAAVSDGALERVSLARRSATLDGLARAGNALGTGRHLLPALGAGYLAGRLADRLAGRPRLAHVVLHAAVAYTAGNVVASVGKPAFGRHRPDTTGSPWRLRPFARQGAWHSLPSAHTLHAFTLAGAVAEEAGRPWVTAGAYGAAALVGWSRVYEDEHWASDVALSAVVGAAIGHAGVRLLHSRHRRARPRLHVVPWPARAAVIFAW
jgi:membrane-associated phospholipid phosphatase